MTSETPGLVLLLRTHAILMCSTFLYPRAEMPFARPAHTPRSTASELLNPVLKLDGHTEIGVVCEIAYTGRP